MAITALAIQMDDTSTQINDNCQQKAKVTPITFPAANDRRGGNRHRQCKSKMGASSHNHRLFANQSQYSRLNFLQSPSDLEKMPPSIYERKNKHLLEIIKLNTQPLILLHCISKKLLVKYFEVITVRNLK